MRHHIIGYRYSSRFALLVAAILNFGSCRSSDAVTTDVSNASVRSVSVSPDSLLLVPGQRAALSARTTDASGASVSAQLSWSSDNPRVAVVERSGSVLAIATGRTVVRAIVGTYSGSTIVAVGPASLEVAPQSTTTTIGQTIQLRAVARNEAGAVFDLPFAWRSESPTVATVDASGLVTTIGAGTTLVHVTNGGQDAAATVVVRSVASVNIQPSTATLMKGDSLRLVATARDSAGNLIPGRVKWRSDSSSVVAVDDSGVVRALHYGSAAVRASIGEREGVVVFTIHEINKIIIVPATISLLQGQAARLQVSVLDERGEVLQSPVTWRSDSPSVAQIDANGSITAVARGATVIRASASDAQGIAQVVVSDRVQLSIDRTFGPPARWGTAKPLLGPMPAVRATLDDGSPASNVAIRFTVVGGGGTVVGDSSNTNSAGIATLGGWTMGPQAGLNDVRAFAVGTTAANDLHFFMNATSAYAVRVRRVGGSTQPWAIPGGLIDDGGAGGMGFIAVSDASGAAAPGGQVAARALGGGSLVSSGSWFFPGIQFFGWRLGTAGPQQLRLYVPGGDSLLVNAEIRRIDAAFPMDLRIDPSFSELERSIIADVVSRFQSIITAPLPPTTLNVPAGVCGLAEPLANLSTRGVVISIRRQGLAGAAGRAGPCVIRSGSTLPAVSEVLLDPSVNSAGYLRYVLLHEMGHALGLGTMWYTSTLISGSGTDDPVFLGQAAVAEFQATIGPSYPGRAVPLTSDLGHWRGSVFGTETLTGNCCAPAAGRSWILSTVSAAALRDLGYTVDLTAADVWTPPIDPTLFTPSILYSFPLMASPFGTFRDTIHGAAYSTDIRGTLRPLATISRK